MNISTLQEKINNAPSLDFGDIFSKSIDLFKKTWIQGLLLQIFSFIVMLPLIIIMYAPLMAIIIAQAESGYGDPDVLGGLFAGMSIIYILFVIVGVMVLGAVTSALNAGFYRIMKRLDHEETVSTSDFFYFLKGKYLSKTFSLMLITILIAIPSALLCYIPLIYVMVPMSFFLVVFAFNPELGVGDIVKLSFNLGNKKWLLTFGLLFVSGIAVWILGMITCGLGSIFLTAFIYHPTYLVYKNVIGFEDDSEINQIGEDLVEF